MSKKLMTLALALAFVAGSISLSFASGASCTGKATAVEGNKVTVTCDDGSVITAEGTAKVGAKVTVKDGKIEAKKKKAIEGC
jgi:hypothetical protein